MQGLALVLALGACSVSGRGSGSSVLQGLPDGSAWRLANSTVPGLEDAGEAAIRIGYLDGRLSGDSGCNRFSAEVRQDGSRLEIGPIVASKMGCPGPRMERERALFEALQRVEQASLEAGQLRLLTRDGRELVFVDDPAEVE